MKRHVLQKYRGGPARRQISVWCPHCQEVYGIEDQPGVPIQVRRCPYGHGDLVRGWIARIVEGLRP
jgi:hypothetical protein